MPAKGEIITVVVADGTERTGKYQWAKLAGKVVMVSLLMHRGHVLVKVPVDRWEFEVVEAES